MCCAGEEGWAGEQQRVMVEDLRSIVSDRQERPRGPGVLIWRVEGCGDGSSMMGRLSRESRRWRTGRVELRGRRWGDLITISEVG
jgi:hypothetical protein